MRTSSKLSLPCVLASAALILSACGGSGQGLIPSADAGPLRSSFEAVAAAAENGNGNCAATQRAIASMERHYANLPQSVDAQLRKKLGEGVENLRAKAIARCEQVKTTSTTQTIETPSVSSSSSTSTTESEAETELTEVEETETLSSSSEGGGTEAPPGIEETESEVGGAEAEEEVPGVGPNGEVPPGGVGR
jgi:hypothetical protein